jgi:hypothetical protein
MMKKKKKKKKHTHTHTPSKACRQKTCPESDETINRGSVLVVRIQNIKHALSRSCSLCAQVTTEIVATIQKPAYTKVLKKGKQA